MVRLAGVLFNDVVQRGEHRRMEYRGRVEHVPGMRRFRPVARTAAGALGQGSVRRGTCGDGTADARACVCARSRTRCADVRRMKCAC